TNAPSTFIESATHAGRRPSRASVRGTTSSMSASRAAKSSTGCCSSTCASEDWWRELRRAAGAGLWAGNPNPHHLLPAQGAPPRSRDLLHLPVGAAASRSGGSRAVAASQNDPAPAAPGPADGAAHLRPGPTLLHG